MRTILLLAAIMCLGCGKGLQVTAVTGKVTLNGEPLSAATVSFTPVTEGQGSNAVGSTDSAGQYKLTDLRSETTGSGAEPGMYNVSIVWRKAAGPDLSQSEGESQGGIQGNESSQAAIADSVPAPYMSPATSGLTAEVKRGESNVFDFDLKRDFKGAGKN